MTRKESGFVSRAMSIAEDIALYPGDAASRGALYALVTSLQSAAEGLEEALNEYRSAIGQGYVAHGLPLGPQQIEADAKASAAISAFNAIKGK